MTPRRPLGSRTTRTPQAGEGLQPQDRERWRASLLREVENNVQAFIKNTNRGNAREEEAATILTDKTGTDGWHSLHLKLTIIDKDFATQIQELESGAARTDREKAATTLVGSKGKKNVTRKIKGHYVHPLRTIQRPASQDGATGTLTADPTEVDKIMREAWHPVYEGNTKNLHRLVDQLRERTMTRSTGQSRWPSRSSIGST